MGCRGKTPHFDLYNTCMRHWMLLPSYACQASCSYCFGPRRMPDGVERSGFDLDQLEGLCEWASSGEEPVQITFHGGEALLAGKAFYRQALPILAGARPAGQVRFGVQSNLWGLDEEWLDLFQGYGVEFGTSLDGPEAINDAQRGRGYFRRTMAGLDLLRKRGLKAGCIATLTGPSARRWQEVLEFFRAETLNVSLHAALMPAGSPEPPAWVLTPDAFGEVLVEVLNFQLDSSSVGALGKKTRIEPVDSFCRAVGGGQVRQCTFDDCLGKFMAVSPDGAIYPCQRFVGKPAFRLGELGRLGPSAALEESAGWQRMASWRAAVAGECSRCDFYDLCRGGCPYQAFAAGDGSFERGKPDPYCRAYRRLFNEIVERGAEEFFNPANLARVVNPSESGRLREEPILRKIGGPWVEKPGEKGPHRS